MKGINKIWALALVLIIGAMPFVQALGAEVELNGNVEVGTEEETNEDAVSGKHRALAKGELVIENKLRRNKLDLRQNINLEARQNTNILVNTTVDLSTRWKERFLDSLDRLEKRLEKTKARISNEDAVANINLQIELTNKLSEEVKADTDVSREEAKEYAKRTREILKDAKTTIKIGTNKLINVRIGGIIKKSEKLVEKLDKVVEKLKAKGKNTSEIEVEVKKFQDNLAKAKAEYNAALELQKGSGTTDETMKQVNEHLRKAHQYLKDANVNLKAAIKLTTGGETA